MAMRYYPATIKNVQTFARIPLVIL